MLKAPGTKRSRLTYDGLLSSFALKFDLSLYNQEEVKTVRDTSAMFDRMFVLRALSNRYRAGAYARPPFGST
jgi:hypothetical protein